MEETVNEIIFQLEELRDTKNISGMEHYGIVTKGNAFGVPATDLNRIAKKYKYNQKLAEALWETGFHEAKKLAALIADKKEFSPELMDKWTSEFYSWDICDNACSHIFRDLPFAYDKVFEYAASDEEYIRRTAFSLIAALTVSGKKSPDEKFLPYLPLIEHYAGDDRNFVKKAVNWALRQIGKKSKGLYPHALALAEKLASSENKSAAWIGKDAVKELKSEKIKARIK